MSEKSRTLPDTFKKTAPLLTGASRDIFLEATDVTLRIDKERRIAEVGCRLPRLFMKKDVYRLEEEIRASYDLTRVMILTHYPSELFSLSYMSEIITEAARVGYVINGFFNKYELHEDGDKICIMIPFSNELIKFM